MVQGKQLVVKGLMAAEWVGMGYLLFTLVVMACVWSRLPNVVDMLVLRGGYIAATLAAMLIYRRFPSKWTIFLRVVVQMVFLSWWYPDTYELNRTLPNLDHVFASWEQSIFGCQPSLLFSQKVPYGWFSELMCLGYVSYFPLMLITYLYYFFRRYKEFQMAAFVMLSSFFAYYVVFVCPSPDRSSTTWQWAPRRLPQASSPIWATGSSPTPSAWQLPDGAMASAITCSTSRTMLANVPLPPSPAVM